MAGTKKRCKAICGNGKRCRVEAIWGDYCTRHYKGLMKEPEKEKIGVKKVGTNREAVREPYEILD